MTETGEETWLSLGSAAGLAVADLAVGDKKELALPDGGFVLVLRTAQGLHACSADCPHLDAPLAEGLLDGTVLTCPEHFWQWDLVTGEPLGPAEMPLPLFDVREEHGQVQVRARPRLA